MPFWLQCLAVFAAMVAVDCCWARYIERVGQGKAFAAAVWSGLIMVCGAFAVVSYLHDMRLLAAAVAGAFTGTYLTVRFGKK